MYCEYCNKENNNSTRFCSKTCARGFSTKEKRKEINEKVSIKLKNYPNPNIGKTYEEIYGLEKAQKIKEELRKTARERSLKGKPIQQEKRLEKLYKTSFNDLSLKLKKKKIIIEQNYKCLHCKNEEWLGIPIVLEIDHIDGDKKNNNRTNLRVLCPNCHAQTKTWKGRNMKKYRLKNNLNS